VVHRIWLALFTTGLLGLLAGRPTAALDADAKSAVIHFRNGDFVSGRLLDSADADNILWQADGFARPLQFAVSGMHSVQFPLPPRRPEFAGPYCFELAGGDSVSGQLVSLDDREAVLEIAGLGTLHVERAGLQRLYKISAADLIFAGPAGLEGWRQTVVGQVGEADKAWSDEAGQLRTDQPGARIHRHFRPPPLVRYEFELAWTGKPNFELAAGLNENADRSAFRIETWGDELVVTRESGKQADVTLLQTIHPGAGQVRLLVLYDQPQGRLLVYSSAGEKLADFTVPEDKSSPPAAVIKAKPGLLLRAPTSKPELPGGLQLTNRQGDIKLRRLTIHRWSGIAPQPAAAEMATIHQTDGTIRSAEVRSFEAATRQLVLVKNGEEQRVEERQIQDIVLTQPEESPPRSVRVLLTTGARLSGELTEIQQESITLKCPGIQEPLVLAVKDLQAVLILREEAAASDEDATAPDVRDSRLDLAGVWLRGRLVDASAGETSCLVFQPRNSTVSSPLAASASGKLILHVTSPLRKPNTAPAQTQSPALQIVNGMRTMLGVRQTPSMRPAPPGDCLLHLRWGDTLPCRVQFIDERGVTFKSTVTDAEFVPHERIKALELRLDARPVKIEKTKFERLLTLPRMQRDNPPEQLIRSLEGDYLRGRLLAMNDTELQVELRLETKTIDRSQVTRILWLHPDEAAKATGAKPLAPQSSEKLPAGTRVQAVPRGGNRLTFFAQELSGKILSGQSDVLGACRVDLDQIDQLLIGNTIEEAASSLAFHQWKLRPAAEPLPDPEPGSDPGVGAGMESVLVGKVAPDIDLELLDGKKFRLADRKNNVVVLDFWASWCGPCLQAMPQVDSACREFAEQGVQLVAINLEESSERIKTTLQRLKLDTAVALDKDGRVAERYGATAIPQTVIIDREGKVARLFVGGGARFDEQLRQALKSVLDRPVTTPAD
jgi:thiol-disulfide isomerase/thioredoxin